MNRWPRRFCFCLRSMLRLSSPAWSPVTFTGKATGDGYELSKLFISEPL